MPYANVAPHRLADLPRPDVAKLREKLGTRREAMSVHEFAARYGMAASTVYQWEAGGSMPLHVQCYLHLIDANADHVSARLQRLARAAPYESPPRQPRVRKPLKPLKPPRIPFPPPRRYVPPPPMSEDDPAYGL